MGRSLPFPGGAIHPMPRSPTGIRDGGPSSICMRKGGQIRPSIETSCEESSTGKCSLLCCCIGISPFEQSALPTGLRKELVNDQHSLETHEQHACQDHCYPH